MGFCDLAKLLSWARRGCFVSFVFFACCVATVSGCALPVCAGFGRRRACVRWWRCPCGAWGCVCECVCACVRVRACACVCVRVRAFACVCSSITSMASFFLARGINPTCACAIFCYCPFCNNRKHADDGADDGVVRLQLLHSHYYSTPTTTTTTVATAAITLAPYTWELQIQLLLVLLPLLQLQWRPTTATTATTTTITTTTTTTTTPTTTTTIVIIDTKNNYRQQQHDSRRCVLRSPAFPPDHMRAPHLAVGWPPCWWRRVHPG